jgi:hypothetical protein
MSSIQVSTPPFLFVFPDLWGNTENLLLEYKEIIIIFGALSAIMADEIQGNE